MTNFDYFTDDDFLAQIDESIQFEMDDNTFDNNDDIMDLDYND